MGNMPSPGYTVTVRVEVPSPGSTTAELAVAVGRAGGLTPSKRAGTRRSLRQGVAISQTRSTMSWPSRAFSAACSTLAPSTLATKWSLPRPRR
jgi:hypothetical protein